MNITVELVDMDSGEKTIPRIPGNNYVDLLVTFTKPFNVIPSVIVGIKSFFVQGYDSQQHQFAQLTITEITKSGFTCRVKNTCSNYAYGASGSFEWNANANKV